MRPGAGRPPDLPPAGSSRSGDPVVGRGSDPRGQV